jgi:hypothetical protein
MFGFQLIVTSMPDFDLIPAAVQRIHFAALALVALAIIVLMTPGPVHRLAFCGREDARSHRAGSQRAIGFGGAPIVASVLIEGMLLSLPGAFLGALIAWALFNGNVVTALRAN